MKPKKRIIFSLIYSDGFFCQSRNFALQRVGDLNWLLKRYNLPEVSRAVDELQVLDASRSPRNILRFAEVVESVNELIHIPLSAGGGIRSVEDAMLLVDAGADKLVFSSSVFDRPDTVRSISVTFGKQATVALINYRGEGESAQVFSTAGQVEGERLLDAVDMAQELGFGEMTVNSIDRDGTGTGLDLTTIASLGGRSVAPLVASGGIGTSSHMIQGLQMPNVAAVATSNILNFVGSGFMRARAVVRDSIELPKFVGTSGIVQSIGQQSLLPEGPSL